ncbi:acyltransferase domain-containing protein [Streptomyces kanamyceticus]|uniref:Acyltransferase domain-containing protein n=2 Tax=Streptomyces kanamyceticus TaxID=1967 RepID=A0A5J6GIG8_STRKN|nr:acyltransferase domain-containing protein [Streptomyces kanamyceticus]
MSGSPAIETTESGTAAAASARSAVAATESGVARDDERAIAVIGMACRLPGARDLDAFWRLLDSGSHAITETPADRWDAAALFDSDVSAPGKVTTRYGGYLDDDDVRGFDAAFFAIGPKEATAMDPQQRLVLELAWSALENAGIVPAALRDSATGVFVGAMWDDYTTLVRRHGLDAIDRHSLAGTQRTILANRVSYSLGLRGPSIAVDSGQSSSLVAVHLAVESLRRGESELALVGGVSLNLVPDSHVTSGKLGGFSPDGRCYAFDARANGYVRGEGAGVVVLKPLARALADGDPITCVIRGSAVNNDGGGSGLATPRAAAQESVLRQARGDAGVAADQVQYVELHGTGTPVGDPVEAAALGAAFGTARAADDPLLVGSVKTNIGHLESAAGIAGLIKTALSLHHRTLPASLNFESPNPNIALTELGLKVRTESGTWPHPERPLVAGVSSWGMGGTNAHVIVEQAPVVEAAPQSEADVVVEGPVLWPVSGKSVEAVRAQGAQLASFVRESGAGLDAAVVSGVLAGARSQFEHRAVVTGADAQELTEALEALAAGQPHPGLVTGIDTPGRTVFLFTGQGSQRPGMARELYESSAVFAAAFDEVCVLLDAGLPRPLKEVVFGDDAELVNQTQYAQAGLFAVQVGLFRLSEHRGLRPDVVLGHSIGELAAAYVAGLWSLADACTLVAARGRLMQAAPTGGAMATLTATEEEVLALLAGRGDVGVAAVNSADSLVISGEAEAVAEIAAHFAQLGRRVKHLHVSHAFHSAHMDSALPGFEEAARQITYQPLALPLISNVTGRTATDEELAEPGYWVRQLRGTVRFADGLRYAQELGATRFVELGPDAVLSTLTPEDAVRIPLLRRTTPDPQAIALALATAHTHGIPLTWPRPQTHLDLPTYPFQHTTYWIQGTTAAEGTTASIPIGPAAGTGPEPKTSTPVSAPESVLAQQLAAEPSSEEQDRVLLDLVRTQISIVLGHATADTVASHLPFKELGFDSLAAVEFRDRLNSVTGLVLPSSLTFDHPTPTAVVGHLRAELLGEDSHRAGDDGLLLSGGVGAGLGVVDDPVVIVGMSCRLPGGVGSPGELWSLLAEGGDAISSFPDNRGWDLASLYDADPDHPGTAYVTEGGFLHDADEFDAAFFGISPREALATDPQQRLLLETAWEAFEHAGIAPERLRGSRTGMFVGATSLDYGPRLHEGAQDLDGYLLTGSTTSVISGRLAYTFGLEGPAVTVDTACSSSLVALHLAAQALRGGECSLALAGGVTVMATPGMFVEFSRQRGLAPDGRVKAFADGADGTAWGEGAGLLVLERLSDARRNGHQVLAVLRGSAVNQDGASNGLTAPNGPSQERMIRQALASARLSAADVDAVEAHGTGTRLGDPIEAQALLATYGQDRAEDRPLWLGSVKSNIGHTQAAAGVAGVIKMVQAMRHGVLPRTLHVDQPSPHVDWSAGAVELLTEATPWPDLDRPRRSAVSSFGISGTNAHVILEQAPVVEAAPQSEADVVVEGPVLWPVSGKSVEAVRAQGAQLASFVRESGAGLDAAVVSGVLAGARSQFEHRAVVTGADAQELTEALEALAAGQPHPGLVTGIDTPGRTVFLFTGQGSQRPGMARELYESSAVFAAAFDEVCALLDAGLPRPLKEVVFGDDAELVNQTQYAQAGLFAVQVGLFRLSEHRGLRPDVVLGHSIGELAAAYVAGLWSLADACTLVAARGRLMQAAPTGGAMATLTATEDEVLALLAGRGDVGVAAVNSADSLVISGEAEAVAEIAAHFTQLGRRVKHLHVSHAFHSAHMDSALPGFEEAARQITYQPLTLPLISNVTGQTATDEELADPGYWVRQLRGTVRFADGLRHAQELGATRFVELGPDAVLSTLTPEDAVRIPLLRRTTPDPQAIALALATAHTHGIPLTWPRPQTHLDLPTYPFQQDRYWLHANPPAGDVASLGQVPAGHGLLGAAVSLAADGTTVFTGRLSLTSHPWLADHAVNDTVLVPGTAFVELALHAGHHTHTPHLDDLTIETPLTLTHDNPATIQVLVGADSPDGSRSLTIHSHTGEGTGWTRHATATLTPTPHGTTPEPELTTWPPTDTTPLPVEDFYDRLAQGGYHYGPSSKDSTPPGTTPPPTPSTPTSPCPRHRRHPIRHPPRPPRRRPPHPGSLQPGRR